jgi:C_GCAxxG_C_C family probable redox protein
MIDREQKILRARELFLSGYNCAQSVAAAFAPEMGMEERTVLRLSSGFGGGLGGLRVMCGTVSAMCMVMSYVHGYDDADDFDGKKHLYATEQRMAARFTDRYGTLNCRELLTAAGIEVKNTPSERTPEYYRKRPCVRYVEACAGILADELNELG